MAASGHMYAQAKTWNPFKGCEFDCSYCIPSFQLQAKRQMHNCMDCYHYTPHKHPERLKTIPGSEIVFVCGNGDISFCDPDFTREIIASIADHGKRKPGQTFYLQSKEPKYFNQFLSDIPGNVILVTTLETNRDSGYREVSKAPLPSERYEQFRSISYPRKVLTIEPVLDFDLAIFSQWILDLNPEYVWLGFNSRAKQVSLPEPTENKVRRLAEKLLRDEIEVRGKKLRGMDVPGVIRYQD